MNSSYVSSTTSLIRASARSTLLTTRTTGRSALSALRSTNRVWGSGPSLASTRSTMPSTIDSPRSTSPPKSAWPGVSMMLIVIGRPPVASTAAGPAYRTAVFLARIVMPFSRSSSPESIARSSTCWCSPKAPACQSIASTSVVFPWSTWATIATLRRSDRTLVGTVGVAVSGMRSRFVRGEGWPSGRPHPRRERSRVGRSGYPPVMTAPAQSRVRFVPTTAEHGVTTLELFFDLVFVFAITQVTAFMAEDLGWRSAVRGLVVLALLWWAWSSYAWLGNQVRADEGIARLVVLLAMAALFLGAMALPEAWSEDASLPPLLLGAYAAAAGDDAGLRHQLARTAVPVSLAAVLLVLGAVLGGSAQTALW